MSGHQADLIPYPGFWYRVLHSDMFDISVHDPWRKSNLVFNHRVKIGWDNKWEWLTLPIDAHLGQQMKDVKLKNDLMYRCWTQLERVYSNRPNWNRYRDKLYEMLVTTHYTYMWEFNFALLIWIRDELRIKVPFGFSYTPEGEDTTTRIASQFKPYHAKYYLSGGFGETYLNQEKYFDITGTKLLFSQYKAPVPYQTVSVLSAMMDFDDPLELLGMYNNVWSYGDLVTIHDIRIDNIGTTYISKGRSEHSE